MSQKLTLTEGFELGVAAFGKVLLSCVRAQKETHYVCFLLQGGCGCATPGSDSLVIPLDRRDFPPASTLEPPHLQ